MIQSEHPFITIGIPTYNRAEGYLKEALESALAQNYSNIEIVITDNCSTDNTTDVVKSYADNRIRYFRHEKGIKPNDNFNFCLQQARGTYFLMLHDDDKIDPDFLETCIKAANGVKGIGAVITGLRLIDESGTTIHEIPNNCDGLSTADFFLGWFNSLVTLYLCNTLYDTTGLKRLGGFKSKHDLFQDVGATIRMASNMGRVDVNAVKASARLHMGKSTHVANVKNWCEDSLELLDLICRFAPEKETALRDRGMRFFANINYNRANSISSMIARTKAYYLVYRFFERRYPPSYNTMLRSTAAYHIIRNIKKKLEGKLIQARAGYKSIHL